MVSFPKITILAVLLAAAPAAAYAVETVPAAVTPAAQAEIGFEEAAARAVAFSAGVKQALADLKYSEAMLEKQKGGHGLTVRAGVKYSEDTDRSLAFLYPESEKMLEYTAGLSTRLITGGDISLSFSSSRAALFFPAYSGPIDAAAFRPSINPYYYPEAALALTQPLLKGFWGFPEIKKIQAAEYRVKAARDSLKKEILSAVHALKSAYYAFYCRDIALRAGRIYLKDVESSYAAMKAAGSGEAALLFGRAAVISASAAQGTHEKKQKDAAVSFLNAAGYPPEEWGTFPSVPEETVEDHYAPLEMTPDLLDTLTASQPAVTLEKNLKYAAEMEKDAAISFTLPELNLCGSIGINGLSDGLSGAFEDMGALKYGDFTVGAYFSWDIPDGISAGEAQAKKAGQDKAQNSLDAAANSCRVKILSAFNGLSAEKARYAAEKEARLMLEKRAALLRQAGAWTELFRAHLDRFEARKREAEAFAAYGMAIADWNLVNGKYDAFYNEYVKNNY